MSIGSKKIAAAVAHAVADARAREEDGDRNAAESFSLVIAGAPRKRAKGKAPLRRASRGSDPSSGPSGINFVATPKKASASAHRPWGASATTSLDEVRRTRTRAWAREQYTARGSVSRATLDALRVEDLATLAEEAPGIDPTGAPDALAGWGEDPDMSIGLGRSHSSTASGRSAKRAPAPSEEMHPPNAGRLQSDDDMPSGSETQAAGEQPATPVAPVLDAATAADVERRLNSPSGCPTPRLDDDLSSSAPVLPRVAPPKESKSTPAVPTHSPRASGASPAPESDVEMSSGHPDEDEEGEVDEGKAAVVPEITNMTQEDEDRIALLQSVPQVVPWRPTKAEVIAAQRQRPRDNQLRAYDCQELLALDFGHLQGMTDSQKQAYWWDLFHQNRFYSGKRASNSAAALVAAWSDFSRSIVHRGSAWLDAFAKRKASYMSANLKGIMMMTHQIAYSATWFCPVPKDMDCPLCVPEAPKMWETEGGLEQYVSSSRIPPHVDEAIRRLRDAVAQRAQRTRAHDVVSDVASDPVGEDAYDRTLGRPRGRPESATLAAPKYHTRGDNRASGRDSAAESPDHSFDPDDRSVRQRANTAGPVRRAQEPAAAGKSLGTHEFLEMARLRGQLTVLQAKYEAAEIELQSARRLTDDAERRLRHTRREADDLQAEVDRLRSCYQQDHETLIRENQQLRAWAQQHWDSCLSDSAGKRVHSPTTESSSKRPRSESGGDRA